MDKREKESLQQFFNNLARIFSTGQLDAENACRTILERAKAVKEMTAFEITGERGRKGYVQFCDSVQNSTVNTMRQVLFADSYDPCTSLFKGHALGLEGDALVDFVIKDDRSGKAAMNRQLISDTMAYLLQAKKYDDENLELSRKLAGETFSKEKPKEPDLNSLKVKLAAGGMTLAENPKADREKEAHDLLVKHALDTIRAPYNVPRWARTLMKRPGITEEEKKSIEEKWNRDREGKKEVFEMFFREIEQADVSYFDVTNLDDYLKNYEACNYLGGLAFDREMAVAEYGINGFYMSPGRKADLAVVSRSLADIQNKFDLGIDVMENPRYKYIENSENLQVGNAAAFMAVAASEPVDESKPKAMAERFENISFSGRLLNYINCKLPSTAKAKDIINYNKEHPEDERAGIIAGWYEEFKKTMAAEGIDLNDPLAMARIRAQVPGGETTTYMPAMKGMNENYFVPGKPPIADSLWYAENLNSANQLTQSQIADLYELSKHGCLAIYGKDMTLSSLRVIYNDKAGKPQVSKLLDDVDSLRPGEDEESLAKEMFPDTVHPLRVFREACTIHEVNRNQAPMYTDENGETDFDYEEVVRTAYERTLFRDYFEHPGKYAGDPQQSRDRAAQVYTVCRYSYGSDDEFKKQYEQYMTDNVISFESDDVILSDQQKAINSLNDPRLNAVKVPKITREMYEFVNSIAPMLKENGWDIANNCSDKASLRIFTDRDGIIREIPACAPMDFSGGREGFFYKGSGSELSNSWSDPMERYLLQNTRKIECSEDALKAKNGIPNSELIRIALIYESAKKGQLLINKPGDPTASAVPIIPGEDGKAKLVTDFDALDDSERKKDYYANASRIRRLYKDPNEKAKREILKKYADKIDGSFYESGVSSLATACHNALDQAEAKGVTDKRQFVEQMMALEPQVVGSIEEAMQNAAEAGENVPVINLNRIKPKAFSARKDISRLARENFFGAEYEKRLAWKYTEEAVKRNLITAEQGNKITAARGMTDLFYDWSTKPDALENNLKAIQILANGTPEQKTQLYNERLEKFANFNVADYYELSDAQLAEKAPEIEENMFRLQELIRLNESFKGQGIVADPQLLKNALDSERQSANVYFYLTNRLQAIASPVYENVDTEQLIDLSFEDLHSLGGAVGEYGDNYALSRFVGNLRNAQQGLYNFTRDYIANQLEDNLGIDKAKVEFYDKDGNALNEFQVAGQMKKGRVVFAAAAGYDQVFAFRSSNGSVRGDMQPSEKYAKKITSLTEQRKELRLAAEEKEMLRDFEKYKKEVEARERQMAKIAAERKARRDQKPEEIDGEALDALFNEDPDEIAGEDPKALPDPEPEKSETEIIREKTQAAIKEEIEYQQAKLGLIVDSYGSNGLFKDKISDFKAFSGDCVAEIMALSNALEQTNKENISKAELERISSKEGVGAIKAAMLEEESCKKYLDDLNEQRLVSIAAFDKDTPEKLQAAKDLYSDYKVNDVLFKETQRNALQQKYKEQARQAMNSGIDKYMQFSNKLDDVIDYGQYKLGAAGRSIKAHIPGAVEGARACLAEVFAAVTVKDIIDSKNMTYKQAEGLSSPKALKNAGKEIMSDPAFNEFFDKLANTPDIIEAVGAQDANENFNRELINGMLNKYKDMRKEMLRNPNEIQKDSQIKQPGIKPMGIV